MKISEFLYRQKQRLILLFEKDTILRNVASINLIRKQIALTDSGFWLYDLELLIPRKHGFVFQQKYYSLFINNTKLLDGCYEIIQEKLLFRFNGLVIEITSGSELYIINEIFINKCYRFLIPDQRMVQVVDIGMNVGLATLYFTTHPQVKRIHSYEPFKPTYLQALVNLKINEGIVGKVHTYNFGLGKNEEVRIVNYDSENKGINSSLTINPKIKSSEYEELQIKPACGVLNSLFATYPDDWFILKIDTEGAEYAIFDSLFQSKLSHQVRGILMEWHYQGPEKLEQYLLNNGFILMSLQLNVNGGIIYAFRQ